MFKMLKYLKEKDWLYVIAGTFFIVVQVWLDLKIPDYMSEVTKLVQSPSSEMREIWINGGYMMLCAFGSLLSAIIVGYIAARVAASFSMSVRSSIFSKVESFSMEEINRFSTSSLITRSTNDITQVQMLITMALQVLIKAPIMAVWAITKISSKSWQWSITTATAVAVIIIMLILAMIFVIPKFKRMQVLTDNLTRVTRENLTGLRVVRAYNAEDYQSEKFEVANNDLTYTHLFTGRAMAMMMPVMSLIMNGLTLAVYWIGAYLIDSAPLADKVNLFSDMVVFSSYSMQVIMSFIMLIMVFVMFPRASVSAKRINEVLDTRTSIVDGGFSGETRLKGQVEFQNVSFKYPDAAEYVLENVSFTANQGETVAFIGSTGSGKSTLINLVPRFFDVTEGSILIDGIDVREYKQEALNDKIGYVPQRAVLFRGDISSNVAFGEKNGAEFDENQVRNALDIAQGLDFVENMEGKLDAEVAQGGSNLSGGQKQRIAIARAVCRKPEIYIFDDSFSALDYKTDRILRSRLKKETSGVTSLIVAQRIGTIIDADKIVVLDEGKVVGIGTHSELLKSCNVYKQIALSQLSEEELDNE